MKKVLFTIWAVCALAAFPALAEDAGSDQSAATSATFSTSDTTLGELLDNSATNEVLVKHIPDLISKPMIRMARGSTLKEMQAMGAPSLTDEVLTAIDADLAKIH